MACCEVMMPDAHVLCVQQPRASKSMSSQQKAKFERASFFFVKL